MNVNFDDLLEFYELRVKTHVKAVNYFASLLGYHFPEHDGDKVVEPIRTGYAYVFYKTYHKNFNLSQNHIELCNDAIRLHHEHASHHIQSYKNVRDIPDVRIYEMVADWSSANFEQKNILHDPESVDLDVWFNKRMANLDWTEHQLEIIRNSIQKVQENTDAEYVKSIWQQLLEKSDL